MAGVVGKEMVYEVVGILNRLYLYRHLNQVIFHPRGERGEIQEEATSSFKVYTRP